MTTISELLARNARTHPHDTALIELKPSKKIRNQITWKEFDERANAVANALMDMGIRKDDKVIHWMMNSISWLEAYFGIIRTGAWAVQSTRAAYSKPFTKREEQSYGFWCRGFMISWWQWTGES